MVDNTNNTQDDGFFLDESDPLVAHDEPIQSAVKRPSLNEIFQNNPSLKVFAVVTGVALVLISFLVFGSDEEIPKKEELSTLGATSEVSEPPGTKEVTPAYEQAVRQANETRTQQALATGGSVLPTPIARPPEQIQAPIQEAKEDPLTEWRREAEVRRVQRRKEEETKKAEAPPTPAPTPAPSLPVPAPAPTLNVAPVPTLAPAAPAPPPLPTAPTPEQVQAYMQSFSQQIGTVMQTQTPKESTIIKMTFPSERNPAASNSGGTGTATVATQDTAVRAGQQRGASAAAQQEKPIITVGTIAYAQMITEANSDIPGPILAEVASGPLAGGRAIGTFQVADDKLILQFNRVVKNDVEYTVQAYAIDPATTLTGVATDVDNHYFTRVFLPAAAEFITSYADAITQRDQTVVVSNGTVVTETESDLNPTEEFNEGVREASDRVGDFIEDKAQRPITVRVEVGTRLGLLFISSVFDPNSRAAQAQQEALRLQQQQQSSFTGQISNFTGNLMGQQQGPGAVPTFPTMTQQYQQYQQPNQFGMQEQVPQQNNQQQQSPTLTQQLQQLAQ